MGRRIYISEDKIGVLSSSKDEMTYFKFQTEVKKFLRELLSNPINADITDYLKGRGISRDDILNRMLDRGIVIKKEGFDERYDAESKKKKSIHHLKYTVCSKNFEDKMHRLYDYFK